MSAERALLYCAGGGIGDSLVASIVARALRTRYAGVDALTLPSHRPLLQRVPDIDETLVDEGGDERELARTLAHRGYAACVVTWATARTARIPQLAEIGMRVGQARRFYSFRFTRRIVVRSELGDVTSHWADILLDFARAIGCDTKDRMYRVVPTPEDEAAAAALRPDAPTFFVLNPCNAVASKRGIWPIEGWTAVARDLHERFGAPVLVSGATGDSPAAQAIARAAGDGVTSIAGRTGIGAFAALAREARAFVGITTGSMHVAAAAGCPTVGIFPFQSDFPDRWAPLSARAAVVRASYRCHARDTKESCRDYACIANLDRTRILAAVTALVA